jgi:cystathionine beta-lyase/cystathionine gamma-synthase
MMSHNGDLTAERATGRLSDARILSPRRKSTRAQTTDELAEEQLAHFGIDPDTEFGDALLSTVRHLYEAQSDVTRLWRITAESMENLPREDRIARFNAKKFLSFQIAKVLDTAQNPFRRSYQALGMSDGTQQAKGPYPVFDNVTALFSANPVIVRTATYIYACTEWIDEAFHGKEHLHEIYSRLLNPTSISLANYIVDLEAGPEADRYLAWNFNSGMAAIDTLLGHLLGSGDIVIVSRNVYGGTHQLLADYYADPRRLGIHLEWFDGTSSEQFEECLDRVRTRYAQALQEGAHLYVYLESPCNPHGYVLDVPAICRRSHEAGAVVMHDSTIATPFLSRPLRRAASEERPDYVIHSYTKDLTGSGNATAGVVIGRNRDMFIPKGETFERKSWEETLFWDAYYIKGAFLDSDKAFEVIAGMKTLELRMLRKCINTRVLAEFLDRHPLIDVRCSAVADDPNHDLARESLAFALPAPLFTISMEHANLPREAFVRFFDSLSPMFNHEVTLGQSNTTILCPALTSHSELGADALRDAGITATTIRIAVGDENPKELIGHFVSAARLNLDPAIDGFSDLFPGPGEIDDLARSVYLETHESYIDSSPSAASWL